MSQKIFDNDLGAIRKNNAILALNKLAYAVMFILDFSKVMMYEFHYDQIKKYGINSRLLFIDTDNLMYEIEIKDVYQYFSKVKDMFDLSNYLAKSKYYEDSNRLVVDKKKYQKLVLVLKNQLN